ncbi:hypothetical protein SNE40_017691 [Patella caerulea]
MVLFMQSVKVIQPNDKREINPASPFYVKRCIPKYHIAFLKVHKSGSSTVANIIQRFALENNLNVVLPLKKPHVSHYNYIGDSKPLTKQSIIPLPNNQSYDILYNHVIYNRTFFRAILPPDTFYFAIVREPVDRFLSAARYYGLQKQLIKNGILNANSTKYIFSKFLENQRKLKTGHNNYVDNGMAHDFGVPRKQIHNISFVKDYLKQLDKDFHFVMLMEYFDESLILLKKLLCWDIKHVLYIKLNTFKGHKDTDHDLSNADIARLHEWQEADFLIYKHFSFKFSQLIHSAGSDFLQEVRNFKDIVRQINKFCIGVPKKSFTVTNSQWNEQFVITRDDCKRMNTRELKLHDMLVQKALDNLRLSSH